MDRAFHSDGCSVVAEYDQRECCVQHDWLYWQGGRREQRREADQQLRDCIQQTQTSWLANIRWFGVRIGGVGFLPFRKWRWGFGWRWPRSSASTPDDSPYSVDSQRPVYEELLAEARVRDQAWRDEHRD